jgi:hypothetical protein
MNNLEKILKLMASNKHVKNVSVEIKRTTSGIKMTFDVRHGDVTEMGLEFINTKDFDGNIDRVPETADKLLGNIVEKLESCNDHQEG